MKFGKLVLSFVSLMMLAAPAFAGELDRATAGAPQGVIVRVDASGNREVFKADLSAKVASDKTAQDAVTKFINADNRIAKVSPSTELDRTSSNEAWYYWNNPNYYSSYYSYSYYNYSYNYYPCYNWNYSNYSYYYYWYRF